LDQGTIPSTQIPHNPNRRFKFEKSRQLFVRTRNETLSIAAIPVNNPVSSRASKGMLTENEAGFCGGTQDRNLVTGLVV
jgi:hypothetical protein